MTVNKPNATTMSPTPRHTDTQQDAPSESSRPELDRSSRSPECWAHKAEPEKREDRRGPRHPLGTDQPKPLPSDTNSMQPFNGHAVRKRMENRRCVGLMTIRFTSGKTGPLHAASSKSVLVERAQDFGRVSHIEPILHSPMPYPYRQASDERRV